MMRNVGSLSRVGAIVLRQYYLLTGSMTRFLPLFGWVAIDIVLWGFISRYLDSMKMPGLEFVPTLLGAVLLWDFLIRVSLGVSMAFFEDVWSRNFLNIFATPLSVSNYLSGLVVSGIASSTVGLVAMLIVATTIFGLSFLSYGFLIVPFLLVLFLFGIALGILGCAMVLRFGPAAEWFVWSMAAFIAPFAGVFYPLGTLPHWMQIVAHALPPSYIFEGMRSVTAGQGMAGTQLACGLGLAVLYVVLACWTFTRVYNHSVRTGLIARYSAENAA